MEVSEIAYKETIETLNKEIQHLLRKNSTKFVFFHFNPD